EPRRRGKFLWVPLARLKTPPAGPKASPAGLKTPPAGLKTKEFLAVEAPNGVSSSSWAETPSFSDTGRAVSEAGPAESESRPAESDTALVVHLGMSGQVLLREPGAEVGRLTRIQLDIEHPVHGELRVDFVDQRIFGSMALDDLVPTADAPGETVPSQVAHIARDPIDPAFDDDLFFARLAKRNTGVKRAMLDQTLISGIGNIYADEALWAARIHYDQPTGALSRPRAKTLLAEVRLVLGKALAEGGTSFDAQYLNVNGESGYFSHSLNAYGQQGQPCPRCGRPIVREQFMNRGSHFCAHCQRVRAA
ncbi:MAG: formamidopyrimidine-DNA glycosylase, partial [Actinomycetota bacterium]|nr:formamidopyrimidine-DNA glycosylase [Actinomycetota bacterium]